jgi:hypothetical protein
LIGYIKALRLMTSFETKNGTQPSVGEDDDPKRQSSLCSAAADTVTHRTYDSLASITICEDLMAAATSGSESASSSAPQVSFNRQRRYYEVGHKLEIDATQSPLHNDCADDEHDWEVVGRTHQSLLNDRFDQDNKNGFHALGEELHALSEDLRRKRRTFGAGSVGQNCHDADLLSLIIDEDDKVKIAGRVSETIGVPGAFSCGSEGLPLPKPSQDQLIEISRLRREQKNRLSVQNDTDLDHLVNGSYDGYLVDALHDSMNAMQFQTILENQKSDEEAKQQKRYNICVTGSAVIFLVIVGTIIGVTVGIGRNNNKGTAIPSSQPPTSAPSLAPTFDVTPCLFGNKSNSQRFKTIQSVITTELSAMTEPIETFGSSARASLCWLSDFDLYEIDISEGRVYELIERFIIGLVYFHFAGTVPKAETDFSDSKWLNPVHVCGWDFLVCDNSVGNVVTELSVESMRLSGSIPSELALLTHLVSIEFAGNNLGGKIPSALWSMTQLQVFHLGPNELTGTISSDLSKLHNLTSLVLGSNYFSGTLPKEIGQLTRLKHIEVSEMFELTGPFPDASNLTNLGMSLVAIVTMRAH